jgi:hypothetical protein
MEAIVSGLITAVASVIVALIARMPVASGVRMAGSARPSQKYVTASWLVIGISFVAVAASDLITPNLTDTATGVIWMATLALAFFRPINPLSAASFTLALHAANLFLGPVRIFIFKYHVSPQFVFKPAQLALFAGNAIIVGLICWWRRPKLDVASAVVKPASTDERIRALETLARLKTEGALTQEEFDREKRHILQTGDEP